MHIYIYIKNRYRCVCVSFKHIYICIFMFEEEIIQPHPAYVFTHMSCEPCAMTSTQLEVRRVPG